MENFHELPGNKSDRTKKSKIGKSEVSRKTSTYSDNTGTSWVKTAFISTLLATGAMTGEVNAVGAEQDYHSGSSSSSLQKFGDSYSQSGVCSLTDNMEQLFIGQRGAETEEVQQSDMSISDHDKQKNVEAIKKAFSNKEFIEQVLQTISNNDDILKKIAELSSSSDSAQLQKILNNPIERGKLAEEVSRHPENADKVLSDPRVKKWVDDAYQVGSHNGKWYAKQLAVIGSCLIILSHVYKKLTTIPPQLRR